MGWTNQVVIASEVIIAGYPDVLLVYDGAPAAGDLIASIAATAAVDQYGNAYTGGIWVYGAASTIGMEIDGGVAYLILGPVGLSHSTVAPNLFAVGRNIGLANEYLQLTLASGKESGNDDAALQLFSETADGTGPAQAVIELGGFVAATFARAGITVSIPIVADTGWHGMTLLNGYSLGASGYAEYKLEPNNRVSVRGANIAVGTATAGTSIWAPAGVYVPSAAVNRQTIDMIVENSTGAAVAETPRFDVTATGFAIENMPASTTRIGFNGSYALD